MQQIIVLDRLWRSPIKSPQLCVVPNVPLVAEDLLCVVVFCREGKHEVVIASRVLRASFQDISVDIDWWIAALYKVRILHGAEHYRDREDY